MSMSVPKPTIVSASPTIQVQLDEYGRLTLDPKHERSKYGIYVISHKDKVIRIGESASGFNRITNGFRHLLEHASGKKNYYAYHWRTNYCNDTLHVDYFPLDAEPFKDHQLRRALEAEITFQFRIHNKSWPERMIEIHFKEEHRKRPEIIAAAKKVMGKYGLKYNAIL